MTHHRSAPTRVLSPAAEGTVADWAANPAILPQSTAPKRLFGLDAARAMAISLVVISHGTGFWAPLFGISHVDGLFWVTGIDGVELFFCLSGYLIGGLLLDIQRRTFSAEAIKIFLQRRWLRTLPLYYLTLIAFWAFPAIEPNAQLRVWSYIPLVQNLVTPMPLSNWFGTSWSLTIEEWSYLALPLLAFACRSARNPLGCAALILCVTGIVVRAGVGLTHGPWDLGHWDVLIRKMVVSRGDAVVYGVLIAIYADRIAVGVRRWLLPTAMMLLAANVWLSYHVARYAVGVVGWLVVFPLTGAAFALLMPWLTGWRTPRHLAMPVQFLARISYALYLVHWSFVFLAQKAPASMQLLLYFGGSLLVATVLSYAVEYPIMRLRPKQV